MRRADLFAICLVAAIRLRWMTSIARVGAMCWSPGGCWAATLRGWVLVMSWVSERRYFWTRSTHWEVWELLAHWVALGRLADPIERRPRTICWLMRLARRQMKWPAIRLSA